MSICGGSIVLSPPHHISIHEFGGGGAGEEREEREREAAQGLNLNLPYGIGGSPADAAFRLFAIFLAAACIFEQRRSMFVFFNLPPLGGSREILHNLFFQLLSRRSEAAVRKVEKARISLYCTEKKISVLF